jgi:hypothetical protein
MQHSGFHPLICYSNVSFSVDLSESQFNLYLQLYLQLILKICLVSLLFHRYRKDSKDSKDKVLAVFGIQLLHQCSGDTVLFCIQSNHENVSSKVHTAVNKLQ